MSKETPEWAIFDRLDELENITLELMDKTSKVEPTVSSLDEAHKQTRKLAFMNILVMFIEIAGRSATHSRNMKDRIMRIAKTLELDESIQKSLDEMMLTVCEAIDEERGK